VLDRVERDDEGLIPLHSPSDCEPQSGNIVFLAPGTGLGAASLVRTGLDDPTHIPVGCECQHTMIPAFHEDLVLCFGALTEMLGHPPTWEDVVSGRGIARVYAALQAMEFGTTPELPDDSGTSAIAEAAASGDDLAVRALATYYRALGAFAQLLALSEQPCAGVFIGGATTAKNIEVIRRGDLVREFLENPFVGQVLAEVPVHVVEGDVNLAGALRIAAQAARSRPPRAQFRSFGG